MAGQFINGFSVADALRLSLKVYSCPVGLNPGDLVYSTGAASVDKAQANSTTTMPAIGVVTSKPTPTSAIVTRQAFLAGFGGLTPNGKVYVSTSVAGSVQQTRPTNFNHVTQAVGVAASATQILFNIDVQSSAPPRVDTFTPTPSQTIFTLTAPPTDLESVKVVLNGITYTKEDSVFALGGGGNQTLTWSGPTLGVGFTPDQFDVLYS